MCDDGRPFLAQVLVAAGVVAMPMGVDDEADRLVAQLPDGGENLLAERRELIVDQIHAIRPGRHPDVAAGPE